MAIATPESYADMLDRAKAGKYAIPAINVTSSQTLSAALQGFTEAESDGIVQVSNGGAAYWSGSSRADRVKGSLAMSAYAYTIADLYPITFALHTDHCPRKLVDTWLRPLLEIEIEQAKRGEPTAFQSHMWDGSAETLDDNIKLAVELLAMSKKANTILEIEIGAVGGEERPHGHVFEFGEFEAGHASSFGKAETVDDGPGVEARTDEVADVDAVFVGADAGPVQPDENDGGEKHTNEEISPLVDDGDRGAGVPDRNNDGEENMDGEGDAGGEASVKLHAS